MLAAAGVNGPWHVESRAEFGWFGPELTCLCLKRKSQINPIFHKVPHSPNNPPSPLIPSFLCLHRTFQSVNSPLVHYTALLSLRLEFFICLRTISGVVVVAVPGRRA